MQKKFQKLSFLLAVCVVLSGMVTLASCAEKTGGTDENVITAAPVGNENDTTANAENDRSAIKENLPDADFQGYKFRILNYDPADFSWLVTELDTADENSETINDAIYKRNRTVEGKYNFTIEEIRIKGADAVNNAAKKSIKSGSDDYDLTMTGADYVTAMASEKLFVDFFEMPVVDLDKPWWDQAQIRDLSLGNHLYFTSGDFTLTHYASTMVMFFNKQIMRDYNLENPYELVKNNQWTIDKFYDLAKNVTKDLNGDGLFDKNDLYGYMSLNFLIVPAWMNASGQSLVKLDDNGQPKFMANTGLFTDVWTKLLEVMYADNLLYDADKHGNHRDQDVMFPGGQVLFWTELVQWSKLLRDMEADFGIIPVPKYSSEQKEWYCYTFGPSYMTVPVTNTDLGRTGHILEALCAESYRVTVPAYYDAMLKTKISRDNESGEMLDLIFANRVYDLGFLYWNTASGTPLITLFKNKDTGIASYIEKNSDKIQAAFDKTMDALAQ